jgi:hypothetical protein
MPFERERRRSPLVLVAYGEEGARWLADVLRELRRADDARRLIELGVIQAWLVGGRTEEGDGIVPLGETPPVETVARFLDGARSLAVFDQVPGLVLTEVRIVERVSLFAQQVERWRPLLVEALRTVPDAVHAPGTQAKFVYRWLAFADSVHDPLGIDDGDRERARTIVEAAPTDSDTLLIDRSTERLASLTTATADRYFAAMVPLLVHADLGAPLASIAGDLAPPVLRSEQPSFCAFALHQLLHRHASLREARRDGFLRALANGDGIEPQRWSELPRAEELERALDSDLAALAAGQFDATAARAARRAAAGAVLVRAFAQQDANEMLTRIAMARRRADGQLAQAPTAPIPMPGSPATDPSAGGRPLSPIPAMIIAGSAGIGALAAVAGALPLIPAWRLPVAIGLALTSAGLAVFALRNRTGTATVDVPATTVTTNERQAEARSEWLALCDELTGVLTAFAALRGLPPAESRGWWRRRGEGVWEYAPEPFWIADNEGPLTLARCIELSEVSVRRLGGGLDGPALLRAAAESVLQDRRGKGRGKQTDLAWIIDPDETEALKRDLERPALLVNPTHPVPRAMVLWFAATETGLHEGLPELEAAQSRDRADFLTIDDTERTLRLEFGEPQPWDRLPALNGSRESMA